MAPLLLGDEVPDFTAQTQLGEIGFHDFISGSWAVLFSHPADFTPVCTTEFGMLAKLHEEFKARNCKVVGLSIDSVASHEAWIKDINETQDTEVDFPIIADEDGTIARMYGMCPPNAPNSRPGEVTVRALFIVDPQRRIQLMMTYPTNTGRNFYEVLRCLDALQLTEYHQVGTPANWKNGEDVLILPSVGDDAAAELFPKGFTAIKPYLRITPMPDLSEGPLATE